MKTLLMATDLTARSDRALQRAIALAEQHDAQLEIIHVVDDSPPQSIIARHEEMAKAALESQVRALSIATKTAITTRIVRGQDFLDILARAEELDADLIILGFHRHATRELFRGTTAERIIRLGYLPVLVVRQPVVGPYQRVLVGVDFSTHSRCALRCAAELAPQAEFQLLHATHVPFKGFIGRETARQIAQHEEEKFKRMAEEELQQLTVTLSKPLSRAQIVVKEGIIHGVLHQQVQEFNPDLIAIGTHGRSGIANAMLGSVAEDLLSAAPTDVLAVKAW
jgi:nucleotide-binding universal stress UspA family protein